MAFKDTSTSDVVGQVWGKVGSNKYLLDQIRARLDFPSTIRAVRTLTGKYPTSYIKLIEDKANGAAVIATLKNEITGLIAIEPNGGKGQGQMPLVLKLRLETYIYQTPRLPLGCMIILRNLLTFRMPPTMTR